MDKQQIDSENDPETLKMLLKLFLAEKQEEMQAKVDTKKKLADSKVEMRKMITKFNADKARGQDFCGQGGHRSEDGKFSLIGGQVQNDGLYHPFCRRCFKEFPPRSPHGTEIENALPV